MSNVVTNVCVKFNYDRLRIDKALGNFRKSNNNKNKNNVRSGWGPFPGSKIGTYTGSDLTFNVEHLFLHNFIQRHW